MQARHSAVPHGHGLDAMVQHGDPLVVMALHVAWASGGQFISDQHGTIESIVRIPGSREFGEICIYD